MEELLLTSGEPAYVNDFRSFYAHSFEGWTVSDGRNYKRPVVFEANEAAAEEMIHGYRLFPRLCPEVKRSVAAGRVLDYLQLAPPGYPCRYLLSGVLPFHP